MADPADADPELVPSWSRAAAACTVAGFAEGVLALEEADERIRLLDPWATSTLHEGGGHRMRFWKASSESLRRDFESTYLRLRVGIAAIGVALPVILGLGAWILEGAFLQSSMSAYYHTGMRDLFVGALFAIGIALVLYQGFSVAENFVLSVAGVLAVCVALFPTEGGTAPAWTADVHGVAAILFFACLAYVSVFRAGDTLSLIRDARRARALERTYRGLGIAMVASPLAALAVAWTLRPPGGEPSVVFFVEVLGIWAFAAYWLVKSWEVQRTSADRAAARGILEPSAAVARGRAPGRFVQTAPLDCTVEELRGDAGLGGGGP